MSRLLRVGAVLCAILLLVAATAGAKERRSSLAPDDKPRLERSGGVSYDIDPLSPATQSWPTINFEGPYYYFTFTNQSPGAEDFYLDVRNVVGGSTFNQVCLRAICFADSTTLTFQPGESDSIGVNVAPFSDGVYTFDFYVESVSDPGQNTTIPLTL